VDPIVAGFDEEAPAYDRNRQEAARIESFISQFRSAIVQRVIQRRWNRSLHQQ
jgi:hypothetical protein